MEMVEQTPQAQGSSVPLVSINGVLVSFLSLSQGKQGRTGKPTILLAEDLSLLSRK